RRTFQAEQEMLPYRRYPLVEMQKSYGREKLFDTAFNFTHFHAYQGLVENSEMELLGGRFFEATNFTLVASFGIDPFSSGIVLTLEYDTAVLSEYYIKMIGDYYLRTISALAFSSHTPYQLSSLLSEEEQQRILVEWNNTSRDYPQDRCLHELFEEQVERNPDAIAVTFEQESISYAELNQRANQLAHYLKEQGVVPETIVGVYMERSLELIIGLMGILKAGGVYLPLDPGYPKERLAFIFEDTRMPVLLTQQKLVKNLPEHQAQPICLDTNWQEIILNSTQPPTNKLTVDNLAYVIYTSGSTGNPKGVMISHRAICNRLIWGQLSYNLTAADKVLQVASASFDFSIWEIFTAILSGAELVIARPSEHQSSSYLVKLIRDHKITIAGFVPSVLQLLLEEEGIEECKCLKKVFCGGEALSFELKERFYSCLDAELQNTYGPTEASIDVTFWDCERGAYHQTVPIGQPIANTKIYMLDQYLQLTPIGMPGELYIGGLNLARGYFNRPDLTAENFIPDPFSHKPGMLLYKTGDLARYLPDGNIEFLGRVDHQVKIRGYRIELGEIEARLNKHTLIKESVVVPWEDRSGDSRLIAYLVFNHHYADVDQGESGSSTKEYLEVTKESLRTYLAAGLPDYMVPSDYIILEALPLTLNGKLDRRALPKPELSLVKIEKTFIAPRDILELQLQQLWEEIVNVSPIGIKDNFFYLGGHSLSALRLIAQIRKRFGQQLPLATLFEGPTIEQQAILLRQQAILLPWSPLVELQPAGSKPPFFCVHPAGGTVFCYNSLVNYLGHDQPFYGLQALGVDGNHEPYTRIEDMAAHYIEAIKKFQPKGPYLLGGWSAGGVIAFEMAQQLHRSGDEVALLALFDAWATICGHKTEVSDEAKLLLSLLRAYGIDLQISADKFQQIDPVERLNLVLEQMRQVTLIPDLELEQIRLMLHVLNATNQAIGDYLPQVYPNQITLFRASEVDHNEEMIELYNFREKFSQTIDDPTRGWSGLSLKPIEIQVIPGRHETLILEPNVKVLAERLKECLEKIE
ncbi:MAG: amino acid adenylation domain-containing protein, partial [Acidobacteriota bacterium]